MAFDTSNVPRTTCTELLYAMTHNDSNVSIVVTEDLLMRCDYMLQAAPVDETQYTRDLITYYLMGIGGMTICSLGIIGNIISLVILNHKSMRSSTYSYLSALSVCDTLVLVFTMVLLVKDVDKPVKGQQKWPWDEGVYPYLFPFIHPAAYTFQVTSIWLTLAFTVDRYIMICHPFKAEPFCCISRARKVIAALFIACILFNIPKFLEYETVAIPHPIQNTTRIGCDLTLFGKKQIFRELYHSWFYIIFVVGIPFLALALLNAFLIHAVRLSRKRGKEINAAEKKRNDTTVMLISVVVVFFCCQMTGLVSRTIWAFEHDAKVFKKLPLYTLNEMGNLMIIINSAINIVPYYFFGRRFRKQFWRIFCSCLLKYPAFNALNRSFSLTVLDNNRRVSNGSVIDNKKHSTTLKKESIGMVNLSADSTPAKFSSASDCNERLLPNNSAVNGNCKSEKTTNPSSKT